MPWLEERTLTLFERDTEVRRYEPGVRERGVDVESPSGPLMGSADTDTDTDTDTDPDRALTLKAPVIHGHLIRQHFLQTQCHLSWHLLKDRTVYQSARTLHPRATRYTNRHSNRHPCTEIETTILVIAVGAAPNRPRRVCQISEGVWVRGSRG